MIVERLLKVALLGSSWVMYLLLVLSVVSIAAMFERYLFFRRHGDDVDALRRKLYELLFNEDLRGAEQALTASPSLEARVLKAALRWQASGAQAVSDVVDSELGQTRKELERGMTMLGTLGNNAPFIGLLGTVIGVIEAFHQLGDAGKNNGAMGSVMAGIAEALVATGIGLFVAIPAVVGYNFAQKKIADIEQNTLSLAKLLTAFIHAREHDSAERPKRKTRRDNHDVEIRQASPEEEQHLLDSLGLTRAEIEAEG